MYKKILSLLILSIAISFTISAQDLRYFKFGVCSSAQDYRDTSFIAATSDPILIDKLLEELALPKESRVRFPNGQLLPGNGGYNSNGNFDFN